MKRFLMLLISAIVIPAMAKTPIFIDEIWGKHPKDASNVKRLLRSEGREDPAGFKFIYCGPYWSSSDTSHAYPEGDTSYKVDGEAVYVNYYIQLDLTPLDSTYPTDRSFYAFQKPISPDWDDGHKGEVYALDFQRTCAAPGSAVKRYLYVSGNRSKDNYYRTPNHPFNTLSSEDIAEYSAKGNWDATREAGIIEVWQSCYTNYECEITFDANGGSGEMDNQIFTNAYEKSDEKAIAGFKLAENGFSRTGHSFDGWATDPDGDVVYKDGAAIKANTFNDDLTLYAHWKKNSYSLEVAASEGGKVSVNDSEFALEYCKLHEYDSIVSIVARPDSGYGFAGWNDGVKSRARQITIHEGDNIYTASFSRGVTVKFHKNSEMAQGTMEDQTYVTGDEQKLSANQFVFTNRRFAGWALSADGQVKYEDGETVAFSALKPDEDMTVNLYAVWEKIEVMVMFYVDAKDGESVSPESKRVICGETYGELPVPVKQPKVGETETRSFAFDYWDDDRRSKVYADTQVSRTDNHYLYAHWKESRSGNFYTVTLDAGREGWIPVDVQVQFNQSVPNLPTPEPDAGYKFDCWTNAVFGKLISGRNCTVTNDSVFTAAWTPLQYTLTLDRQGGKNGTASLKVVYDEPVPDIPSLPEKDGYQLMGYTNILGEAVFDAAGKSLLPAWRGTDNETLYARWKKNSQTKSVTITFNYNGGSGEESSRSILVGNDLGELPSATRDSEEGKTWKFFGWFTAKEGGEQVSPCSVFDRNTTIFARWGIKELNDILGAPEVAFFYEDTEKWRETSGYYLYNKKRTLRAYGVKEGAETGLEEGQKATLVALPPEPGTLSAVYSSFANLDGNKMFKDKFYANIDGQSTNLTHTGEIGNPEWHAYEASAASYVRFTLEKGSDSGGVNAQAMLSDFSWTARQTPGELAEWDSAKENALSDAFKLYGSVKWQVSDEERDRAGGVNGLVVSGVADDGCATVAFVTNVSGEVSFKWRASCESGYYDQSGTYRLTDRLELRTNGVVAAALDGTCTNYSACSIVIPANCEVSWRYVRDADGAAGENKAWLDEFRFRTDGYRVVFSSGSGVSVERAWKFSCVYKLPSLQELELAAPGGKRLVGWKCSNGRRYDDGMLVFDLSGHGESVEMTAIWE